MAEEPVKETEIHPYAPGNLPGPTQRKKREVPDGLWMRCPECEAMLYRKVVSQNQEVCPECQYHFRVGGRQRIEFLVDPDSFEEMFQDIVPSDPLKFKWGDKAWADRWLKSAKTTFPEAAKSASERPHASRTRRETWNSRDAPSTCCGTGIFISESAPIIERIRISDFGFRIYSWISKVRGQWSETSQKVPSSAPGREIRSPHSMRAQCSQD